MDYQVEHVGVVDSTNRRLAERARAGAEAGLVLVADAQTAGRGRQGRAWYAEAGDSLLCSVLLRPPLPSRLAVLVTQAAALAARDTVDRWASAWLKWPNDIWIGERKAAGLLCEAASAGAALDWVVVGLGLNVRRPAHGWPAILGGTAIALSEAAPAPPSVAEVLRVWLDALSERVDVAVRDAASHQRAYADALASMIGRAVVVVGGPVAAGVVAGFDPDGALSVRAADGTLHRLLAADVHLGGAGTPPPGG